MEFPLRLNDRRKSLIACGAAVVTAAGILAGYSSGSSDACANKVSVDSTYTHLPIDYAGKEVVLDVSPRMAQSVTVRASKDVQGMFTILYGSTVRTPFGDNNELILHVDHAGKELVTSCTTPAQRV